MKKPILVLITLMFSTILSFGSAVDNYLIDDSKIDQAFSNAIEAPAFSFDDLSITSALTTTLPAGNKEPAVALLLDFFLGGLGVHRFYLGTEVLTGVGYILTCGGIFGIVPLIDFVVLIINFDDISRFVDNPKFFMWN